MTDAPADAPGASCANCSATLTGAYCAVCGQSREALNHSIFHLAFEGLGDIFTWDGRLLRTMRALYARPGRVARDYVEGKRVSFTPPVRIFLLASLVLIAVMAALDMRLVSIQARGSFAPTGEDRSRPENLPDGSNMWISANVEGGTAFVALTASILDRARGARPIDQNFIDLVLNDPELLDAPPLFVSAVRDPAGVENAIQAAATQALFAMVFVFAFLNLIIHPRRRTIHHLVHALYFHAAVALALAPWMAAAALLPVPRELLAWPAAILLLAGFVAFDRGAYGTSAAGLVWRMPILFVGYFVGLFLVQLGFSLLMIPR